MGTVRLSIESLNKSFASPVLRDVSLSIRHGEIHAIVGENGAGKSTLVNILAGLLPRDSGNIRLDGLAYAPTSPADGFASGVSFAAQELSIIGTLSIAENIALRRIPRGIVCIDRKKLNQRARRMLKIIGLDRLAPETLAESLSLAEQQLVELAKAMSAECRVLILDEPTAALTTSQAERLHTIISDLAATGTSIIYISHRLDDVLSVADTVSVLRDGRVVASVAADTLSVAEIFEMMTGRVHQDTAGTGISERAEKPVLVVEGLTTQELPQPISFTCSSGEIVGIAGLAGSGRSDLLEALFGLVPSTGGSVFRYTDTAKTKIVSASQAVRMGVGYLPKDRKTSGIFSGQSVLVNMTLPGIGKVASSTGLIDRSREADVGGKFASQLAIRCSSLDQDIDQLSGGNQQKALLARWLHCDSDILLLDDPTRGIDVGAKNAIYELLGELRNRRKAIVLVSSEIEELMEVCSRILVLSNRKLVREFRRGEWSEADILAAAFQEFTGRSKKSGPARSKIQPSPDNGQQ